MEREYDSDAENVQPEVKTPAQTPKENDPSWKLALGQKRRQRLRSIFQSTSPNTVKLLSSAIPPLPRASCKSDVKSEEAAETTECSTTPVEGVVAPATLPLSALQAQQPAPQECDRSDSPPAEDSPAESEPQTEEQHQTSPSASADIESCMTHRPDDHTAQGLTEPAVSSALPNSDQQSQHTTDIPSSVVNEPAPPLEGTSARESQQTVVESLVAFQGENSMGVVAGPRPPSPPADCTDTCPPALETTPDEDREEKTVETVNVIKSLPDESVGGKLKDSEMNATTAHPTHENKGVLAPTPVSPSIARPTSPASEHESSLRSNAKQPKQTSLPSVKEPKPLPLQLQQMLVSHFADEIDEEVHRRTAELAETKQALNQVTAIRGALSIQVQSLRKELTQVRTRLTESENANRLKAQQIHDLKAQHAKQVAQLENELHQVRSLVETANAREVQYRKEAERATNSLNAATIRLRTLEKELEESKSTLKKREDALLRIVSALEAQFECEAENNVETEAQGEPPTKRVQLDSELTIADSILENFDL